MEYKWFLGQFCEAHATERITMVFEYSGIHTFVLAMDDERNNQMSIKVLR